MAGIELVWLNWGHKGLERNTFTKEVEEKLFLGTPDKSTGGVDVRVEFYNASEKDIKYVTFGFVAYNAVNDAVASDTTRKKLNHAKFTGPLLSNETMEVMFERVCYNNTITTVRIHEVAVEYMDGTTETIAGQDLVRVYDYSKPVSWGNGYEYNHHSVYYEKIGKEREKTEKERAELAKIEEEKRRAEWAKKQEEQAKRAKKTKMVYAIIGLIFAAILVLGVIASL